MLPDGRYVKKSWDEMHYVSFHFPKFSMQSCGWISAQMFVSNTCAFIYVSWSEGS